MIIAPASTMGQVIGAGANIGSLGTYLGGKSTIEVGKHLEELEVGLKNILKSKGKNSLQDLVGEAHK